MTRVYHHHEKWEDWRAGQYAMNYAIQAGGELRSADLLGDELRLYAVMSAVTREWPNATEHNLTNLDQNRRAWLGQAACCFELGVPAFVVKQGWWTMTDLMREQANAVADTVIGEWEETQRDAETLFGY